MTDTDTARTYNDDDIADGPAPVDFSGWELRDFAATGDAEPGARVVAVAGVGCGADYFGRLVRLETRPWGREWVVAMDDGEVTTVTSFRGQALARPGIRRPIVEGARGIGWYIVRL